MECVEAALKTSIRKEMAVKASPQAVFEDLWGLNGQSGVQNCEDFSVDDLLDFSNDDGFVEQEDDEAPQAQALALAQAVEEDEEDDKGSVLAHKVSQEEKEISTPCSCLSDKNELGPEPTSELSVPADDLENLEWLSHFVEDSFSGFNTSLPVGFLAVKPKNQTEKRPEPEALKPCFKTPVPAKARSKRTRTGGRVWSLGSPSFTESSSSSSSSSSTSSCPSSPWLIYNTTQGPGVFGSSVEKPQKKPKRPAAEGGSSQPPRRCSHCGVQKTPQWRTGPNGAKTLCNACGVRYKSGRLVPEYRPACSPTFSSELHSNHHRKVMEIRRKKEVPPVSEPGLVTTPVVRSF